jgi:hypothetical protein
MGKPFGQGGSNGVQGSFKPCRANCPQESNRVKQDRRKDNAMPSDVTTSNGPADIILAIQTVQAPGTIQVRSSLHATHLLMVSVHQLVLPSLEPRTPVDSAELMLVFDTLKALHLHAQTTANTARMTEVEPVLQEAWLHLIDSDNSHQDSTLLRYLCGTSLKTSGLFGAQFAAWEHLEHQPSPEAHTVAEFIGLCISLSSQLLQITHRAHTGPKPQINDR